MLSLAWEGFSLHEWVIEHCTWIVHWKYEKLCFSVRNFWSFLFHSAAFNSSSLCLLSSSIIWFWKSLNKNNGIESKQFVPQVSIYYVYCTEFFILSAQNEIRISFFESLFCWTQWENNNNILHPSKWKEERNHKSTFLMLHYADDSNFFFFIFERIHNQIDWNIFFDIFFHHHHEKNYFLLILSNLLFVSSMSKQTVSHFISVWKDKKFNTLSSSFFLFCSFWLTLTLN